LRCAGKWNKRLCGGLQVLFSLFLREIVGNYFELIVEKVVGRKWMKLGKMGV